MLALISDIHGNYSALLQVFADLQKKNVQEIICLGDVAATGPQPRECLDLLASHDVPVVLGNADEWLLTPKVEAEIGTFHRQVEETDLWCAEQLTTDHLSYIRSFQSTFRVDAPTPIRCFHGTPRSNREIIEATTPESALLDIFKTYPERVVAGGHTHQPLLRRLQDRILLNPGSVGLGYETDRQGQAHNIPWAEYVLLRWPHGAIQVEFCRVPLNVAEIRHAILASGMPYADMWSAAW